MSDEENGGILSGLRELAGRAKQEAGRAADALERRARQTLAETLQTQLRSRLEKLGRQLSDPDNVEAVQRSLRQFADFTYGLGFSLDPDAERLFEFLDWAERRHGRPRVIQSLNRHNPLTTEEFVDLFEALLEAPGRQVDPEGIDRFERVGRRRLLALLAELSGDTEAPPVQGDEPHEELVDRIEASEAPERFRRLARRAAGRSTGQNPQPSREAPDDDARETHSDSDPSERPPPDSGLGGHVRALVARGDSPLARTAHRLMAPGVRLVTLSFVTALQAYLTRTAIDSLPEMAERSGRPHDEDVFDV